MTFVKPHFYSNLLIDSQKILIRYSISVYKNNEQETGKIEIYV